VLFGPSLLLKGMNLKRANAILLTVLVLVTICGSATNIRISQVYSQAEPLVVDLFTNKAPYDGRGINQASDPFSPYERIVLFALVTYNGDPVGDLLVAFQIEAPTSSLNQIQSGRTNQSGLTSISFSVMTGNVEQTAFGTWLANASTSIGGIHALDTLTFKVGYLITATIRTVVPAEYPQHLVDSKNFFKGNNVGILITLTNIAMNTQAVTLSFVVEDAMNQEIYISPKLPFQMPPGNFDYPLIMFSIPTTAATGNATILLNIYKNSINGVDLYSPQKSATFGILLIDVAITSVGLSATQVSVGQVLSISVDVKNIGDIMETFNVTVYYNNTIIETTNVVSLEPAGRKTLNFSWNTSKVAEGIYTISVTASQVPGEVNTLNNRWIAGQITITQRQTPTPINPRDLYIILWVILLAFLIGLLALLVLRRRRKDESDTLEQMSYFM
jgi:hypothetical protein